MVYINNSRHLARKYARIFVRGHYLFREANSFPRAKLEENWELRGTDNVQGQISEHIFAPCQMATIVFIILQIFFATRADLKIGEYSRIFPSFSWGIFPNGLLKSWPVEGEKDLNCFSITQLVDAFRQVDQSLRGKLTDNVKKIFRYSMTNGLLDHYKNAGFRSHYWVTRIFPSFSWGIFGHVTRLGQSRVSKKIRWIIRAINTMIYKNGERMRDFLGIFIFIVV